METESVQKSPPSFDRSLALLCFLAALAAPAFPQILLDSTEQLAWDRPEAWAM